MPRPSVFQNPVETGTPPEGAAARDARPSSKMLPRSPVVKPRPHHPRPTPPPPAPAGALRGRQPPPQDPYRRHTTTGRFPPDSTRSKPAASNIVSGPVYAKVAGTRPPEAGGGTGYASTSVAPRESASSTAPASSARATPRPRHFAGM